MIILYDFKVNCWRDKWVQVFIQVRDHVAIKAEVWMSFASAQSAMCVFIQIIHSYSVGPSVCSFVLVGRVECFHNKWLVESRVLLIHYSYTLSQLWDLNWHLSSQNLSLSHTFQEDEECINEEQSVATFLLFWFIQIKEHDVFPPGWKYCSLVWMQLGVYQVRFWLIGTPRLCLP